VANGWLMADKMKPMKVFSGQIERDWMFLYMVASRNGPRLHESPKSKETYILGLQSACRQLWRVLASNHGVYDS
jgi:hypothetical protein